MRIEYVFLDNGGVVTDNSRRGPQYQRFVGQVFAKRFGGTEAAWGAANVGIWPAVWRRFIDRVEGWHAGRDIVHETSLYYADWWRSMHAAMNPIDVISDETAAALGKEIDDWINPQIDARIPGAGEAIETLASRYHLYTASDGFSEPLAVALGPHAARFQRLYGPDLVNVPKSSGRPYYDAVFADAGVDPERALVIDDGVVNVLAARAAGARAVLVQAQRPSDYDGIVVARLAELPGIIETL